MNETPNSKGNRLVQDDDNQGAGARPVAAAAPDGTRSRAVVCEGDCVIKAGGKRLIDGADVLVVIRGGFLWVVVGPDSRVPEVELRLPESSLRGILGLLDGGSGG